MVLTQSSFGPGRVALRLLVSVRDADEAMTAAVSGADLIDAKDPDRGALGALAPEIVRAIVARVGTRAITSAVAGEPANEAALTACIAAMASTGVHYVKVAVPADLSDDALAQAAATAPGRLIAVLFAEYGVAAGLVPRLAVAGFVGAMIDTAAKDGRRLTDCLDASRLAHFTASCRVHGLLSGLAGSLAIGDVPPLAGCGADFLGFRGGLCYDSDRTLGLDPNRVAEAVQALGAFTRQDAA